MEELKGGFSGILKGGCLRVRIGVVRGCGWNLESGRRGVGMRINRGCFMIIELFVFV